MVPAAASRRRCPRYLRYAPSAEIRSISSLRLTRSVGLVRGGFSLLEKRYLHGLEFDNRDQKNLSLDELASLSPMTGPIRSRAGMGRRLNTEVPLRY